MRVLYLSICLSLCFALFLCNNFTASAGAKWGSMSEDKKNTVRDLWTYLVSQGYSEISAAAVLGNCNQESYFDGRLGCDSNGTAVDSYAGAFQIAKEIWNSEDKDGYKGWVKENKQDWATCWSDIKVQIQFVEYSCTDGYRSWETYVPRGVVDTYAKFKSYAGGVLVKNSISKATGAFCAGFEGCISGVRGVKGSDNKAEDTTLILEFDDRYANSTWQQLKKRREFAESIYNVLKGSVPPPSSSGTTPNAEDASGDTSSSESIDLLVSGWLKDEYNEDWGIYEHITTELIPLPDGSGLGANEKAQLQVWKEILETEDEFSVISFLRTCVAFVGILLVVYATLVYLAYWVDRVNNFVAFSCLNALTMGRLMISPDDNSSTFTPSNKNVKAVVHRDIVFVSLLGIAIGVILLSGRIYLIIDFFIEFAKDVLG